MKIAQMIVSLLNDESIFIESDSWSVKNKC